MEARAREEKARVRLLRWLETMEASLAEYRLAYLWWTARDGVRSVGNAALMKPRARSRCRFSWPHRAAPPGRKLSMSPSCATAARRERSSPVRAARSSTPAATGPMRLRAAAAASRSGSSVAISRRLGLRARRTLSGSSRQLPKASGRGEKHSKLGSARRSRSSSRRRLGDRRGTVAGGAPAQARRDLAESVGSRLGLEAGNAGGFWNFERRVPRAPEFERWLDATGLRVKLAGTIELLVCGFHSESPSATSHESAANYNRTRAVWEQVFESWGAAGRIREDCAP